MIALTIDVFEKHTPFPLHSAPSPQLSDLTVTFNRTHCGPHKSDTTVWYAAKHKHTQSGVKERKREK